MTPGESGHAIEMLGISKSFHRVRALNEVTIRVKRGCIHALLGENGAGKSTLMKILNGVHPHGTFSGEIRLQGKVVHLNSPHGARACGIGYVPQEIEVIEELTVAENIFVGNWNENGGALVDFNDLERRAAALLARCHIHLDPRQRVAELGASRRQLVMIARALSTNPVVLILDEATACLTLDETRNLFEVVRHFQTQGVTTLFITHKLAEIRELADHVTVLRDGAVVAEWFRGTFSDEQLVAAMVGREISALFPEREDACPDGEALRVENLTIPHSRLKNRNVLEGISFQVRRGEMLGIGGLVGSGRTELLDALYGRIPCIGRIFLEGSEVAIRSPRDALRLGIGLVTEDRKRDGVCFNFDVAENLTLHALDDFALAGFLSAQREESAAVSASRQLAIRAPSVRSAVGHLSGGNQQKVVLGKVLMRKPKVLLLDEPTKGIDVGAKTEIYALLRKLSAEGVALIVVSSELPELLGLCDRFIVLARGRLADEFARSEASEERLMLAATS